MSTAEPEAPRGQPLTREEHRLKRERAGAWGAVLFIFAILTICVSPNIFFAQHKPAVGKPWPGADLATPYRISVPDPEATEIQRRRLQMDHPKLFSFDRDLESAIEKKNAELLAHLARAPLTSSPLDLRRDVRARLSLDLQASTLATLRNQLETTRTRADLSIIFHHLLEVRGVSADKSLLDSAIRRDRAVVTANDSSRITSASLRQVLGYPGEAFEYAERAYLDTFQRPPEIKAAYADVVRQLLRPNIVHNRNQTELQLQQAMDAVQVRRVYEPGAILLRHNDTVTGIAAQALDHLHYLDLQNDLLRTLGGSIFVLLAMLFTGLYIRRYNRELLFTSRNVFLLALPIVLTVALGRIIYNYGGGYLLNAFAMPAGTVGILTVMLFEQRLAIILTAMACVLFAVASGLGFPYTIIGMAGGLTAIASLRNLKARNEMMYTGIHIALANCLVALAVSLVLRPDYPDLSQQLQSGLIAGLINGLVCFMLAGAALPLFENIFQVTTDVLLLELTDGSHPLLDMLEDKAPGTYYHSMNVASLAETAAEAVGAQYLLVRAGAYFHDIGKMLKPAYFTENQTTPEQKQIHSKLSPAMSTLIIKNHVKEGMELAREYRLPEKVIDFIPEHHGTTLIKYFYVQALKKAEQEGSNEMITEEEFRYPGPKPRSIETAILMLADSVEAVSTSRFAGKSPDEQEIRRTVHESVTEKYEDKQLNNTPLTLQDLETIKEAFVKALQSRYHQRVKYPTMPGRNASAGTLVSGKRIAETVAAEPPEHQPLTSPERVGPREH